jgi:hypothetical protein
MVVKEKKKFKGKQAYWIDINWEKENYFNIYESHHV